MGFSDKPIDSLRPRARHALSAEYPAILAEVGLLARAGATTLELPSVEDADKRLAVLLGYERAGDLRVSMPTDDQLLVWVRKTHAAVAPRDLDYLHVHTVVVARATNGDTR